MSIPVRWGGWSAEAVASLRRLAHSIEEADVTAMLGLDERRLRRDLALATAVSALRTGVSVVQAVKAGISLTEALGGEPLDSVALYANINRGLFATQRMPVRLR